MRKISGPTYPSGYFFCFCENKKIKFKRSTRRVWTFTYSRQWAKYKRRGCLNLFIYRPVLVVVSRHLNLCSGAKNIRAQVGRRKKKKRIEAQRGLFANWNGFARSRRVRGLGRSEPGTGRFVAPLRLRRPGIRGFLSFYIFCF